MREREVLLGAVFFLVPSLHPLLIPAVGVPSHLLWFAHVLPVAIVTYRWGRKGGAGAVVASSLAVLMGEQVFGGGYGISADWGTGTSLAGALLFTNGLVAIFALYARNLTSRYQILFRQVTLGVLRTDGEGRILEANPAAAEVLGCGERELKGRYLQALVTSPTLPTMESLERMGGWTGQLELGAGEGSSSLFAFIAAVRHPDTGGYQVILADRSVEILQERELQRKSKLAILGEALAGAAHELRNPLTVIIGNVQLALSGLMSQEEVTESLGEIERQGDRMKEMLAELLGFSRKAEDAEITRVHQLIPRIVRVQRMVLPHGIVLNHDLAWEGELPVSQTKLEQILLNLISNAADALAEAGRKKGEITILTRRLGREILLEVRDNGHGIPGKVLPTIFRPFFTTKADGVGTGLGLAISRRLARSMGGDLTAANLKEGGASFLLTLPMERSEDSAMMEILDGSKPAAVA